MDRLSDVKPNYGYWGRIEHLGKILSKELRSFEKKAKEIENKHGKSIFDFELDEQERNKVKKD